MTNKYDQIIRARVGTDCKCIRIDFGLFSEVISKHETVTGNKKKEKQSQQYIK